MLVFTQSNTSALSPVNLFHLVSEVLQDFRQQVRFGKTTNEMYALARGIVSS